MNELNLFGRIMTQEAANAVGLPVGTTLAKYNASGGSRRSSSGGGGSNQQWDWAIPGEDEDQPDPTPVRSNSWQPMRNAISSLLEEAQRRKNATGGGR